MYSTAEHAPRSDTVGGNVSPKSPHQVVCAKEVCTVLVAVERNRQGIKQRANLVQGEEVLGFEQMHRSSLENRAGNVLRHCNTCI